MSRIKDMLSENHNRLLHSDTSKMTALEVLVVKAVESASPSKIFELMGIEDHILERYPDYYAKPEPAIVISKNKKNPKKK